MIKKLISKNLELFKKQRYIKYENIFICKEKVPNINEKLKIIVVEIFLH